MDLNKLPEVRKIRLQMDWSQLELARRLGVSQSLISYIEKGLVAITPELQKKIDNLKKEHSIETK